VVLRYELAVLRGTIRRDCLDWLLITSRKHLERSYASTSTTTTPPRRR
jgi:hypothetical protein